MAGPTVPPQLSRRKPPPTGDEETTIALKLGEYTDVPCLSVSEANVLLNRIIEARTKEDNNGNRGQPMPNSDVFIKTKDYLDVFARFRTDQAVTQVDQMSQRLVDDNSLKHFERAQLGMLPCACTRN